MTLKSSIIDIHPFPSVCFYKTVKPYQKVVLEVHESFRKRSYRNRFDILSAEGAFAINIPIKNFKNNTPTIDIQIDYGQPWEKKLLRTLETAYANSPYYEFYADDIEKLLDQKTELLAEFSLNTINLLKKWLYAENEFTFSSQFELMPEMDDFRDIKGEKRSQLSDWKCDNTAYRQLFGNEFVENLSVLDLIFNKGPLSTNYI